MHIKDGKNRAKIERKRKKLSENCAEECSAYAVVAPPSRDMSCKNERKGGTKIVNAQLKLPTRVQATVPSAIQKFQRFRIKRETGV